MRIHSFECVVWKMEKVGRLLCCMKDGTCSKLFYWPVLYLAVRVRSFNSMTVTERLNSCRTRIIHCVPRLIHVKSYNLIMIMTCRTTASKCTGRKKSVDLCSSSNVLIFADFSFLNFTCSTWEHWSRAKLSRQFWILKISQPLWLRYHSKGG